MMKLQVSMEELKRIVDEEQWKEDLKIDVVNLREELQNIAEVTSRWAMYATIAEAYVRHLEKSLKTLEAALYLKYRQENNGQKVTETYLKSRILCDPEYELANSKLNEMMFVRDVLYEVLNAFKQKSAALHSIVRLQTGGVM